MTLLALAVYLAVGVSSVLLIVQVSAARRAAPSTGAQVHDVYEAAFLAGGPARVVDAALVALHADGRLAVGRPGVLSVLRPAAYDPVERAVLAELASAPNGALHTVRLRTMRSAAVQEVGDVLAARGLMVPPAQPGVARLAAWGRIQAAVCAIGVPVSIAVTVVRFVGDPLLDPGVPFVFLVFPVLVAGAVIGGLQAGRVRRRVTPAGLSALRSYRTGHARPRTPAEAVALHGPRGVPDPVLRAALAAAPRSRTVSGDHGSGTPASFYLADDAVWCAGSSPGSGGCGTSGGGSGCGGSGGSSSSCGGGSSSGSGCGGSS
jgi:uncharacterized protein (TIGR04222 family)